VALSGEEVAIGVAPVALDLLRAQVRREAEERENNNAPNELATGARPHGGHGPPLLIGGTLWHSEHCLPA
jgi:hypothetical protein